MTIKVVIGTEKGGVAKTTTATNLAAAIARYYNKRVLLVDTDPQANATKNLYPWKREHSGTGSNNRCPWKTVKLTLKDVFEGTPASDVICKSVEPGVDIIPSCKALSVIEQELSTKLAGERVLKKRLASVEDDYDVMIFDTQPSIGWIVFNALYASDHAIIPVCEAYALDAAEQMVKTVYQFRQDLDKQIMIDGMLLTMYDPRTTLSNDVRNELVERYGEVVFETRIHRDVKLAKCPKENMSIFQYDPDTAGALAYKAFTDELMTRWEMV